MPSVYLLGYGAQGVEIFRTSQYAKLIEWAQEHQEEYPALADFILTGIAETDEDMLAVEKEMESVGSPPEELVLIKKHWYGLGTPIVLTEDPGSYTVGIDDPNLPPRYVDPFDEEAVREMEEAEAKAKEDAKVEGGEEEEEEEEK